MEEGEKMEKDGGIDGGEVITKAEEKKEVGGGGAMEKPGLRIKAKVHWHLFTSGHW